MKNGFFVLNPVRKLPDGSECKVFPFHISLEGLETRILCRDDEDCDAAVKIIAVCCLRKNVVLIVYAVVSTHIHCVVLASSQDVADSCGTEIKRMLAMYHQTKYARTEVMRGVDSKAIFIGDIKYLRNAVAYDVRNAMDNGADSVQSYKWTGYRGMFCDGKSPWTMKVKDLTKREKRMILHTNDRLDGVPWVLNKDNELEPASICDWKYVEGAFHNDQSFFLKQIGGVNTVEVKEQLVVAPRSKRTDRDFLASVNEMARKWFGADVENLSMAKKAHLIHYAVHSFKTDPNQIARTFEIDRDVVRTIMGVKKREGQSNSTEGAG